MRQKVRNRNRNRRRCGFTLIEVLLVVGIIALLAAFVVPSYMNTQRSAETDIAKSMCDDGGTLATQLNLYRMAIGVYPEELKELVEPPDDEDLAAKWEGKGPFINDLKKLKDPWHQELQYTKDGEFNGEGKYDLWSIGPDGEDGTDDDIGNWTKED